jgi:tetratricopeptide (TPR) repeat protein
VARTQLAGVLHQRGDVTSAQTLFEDAESRQRAWQPSSPILYSLRGYLYCNVLLERSEAAAVARRATQTLEWAPVHGGWLLDIALDHLSLGRAHLALGELGPARQHFDRAVEGLRAAGQLDYLTRGLLARAAFRRATGELIPACRDLAEALKLVERSGFRLYAADCALEEARIALAESEGRGLDAADPRVKLAEARAAFLRARALVEEMGYGRRQPELAELARALGEADATGGHA